MFLVLGILTIVTAMGTVIWGMNGKNAAGLRCKEEPSGLFDSLLAPPENALFPARNDAFMQLVHTQYRRRNSVGV